MSDFVWQTSSWPACLRWDSNELIPALAATAKAHGEAQGALKAAGFDIELEGDTLFDEAMTTSAIEGEALNRDSVRSSIADRLGLAEAGVGRRERHIEGLVHVLLDATQKHAEPLDSERLWGWHADLFPTERSQGRKVKTGGWRVGHQAMQVVSGAIGKPKVHFVAPPSEAVPAEMENFLSWWRAPLSDMNELIRAGVAHFWFVTIHPFDDGNGRIARALTDMALAQFDGSTKRYYSLSRQISGDRANYYSQLEASQRGQGDVTAWLRWFLSTVEAAMKRTQQTVEVVHQRNRFWATVGNQAMNQRQRKVVGKMLEHLPAGYEGGMTNKKYRNIAKTTTPTATRDLKDLVEKGLLTLGPARGRSAHYHLFWPF